MLLWEAHLCTYLVILVGIKLMRQGDQWAMARQVSSYNGPPTGTIPTSWRRTSPLPATAFPIIPEPASVLEANLLPTVGASRRLDCNGNWVANRDAVDARLINQYKTNTGNNFLVCIGN